MQRQLPICLGCALLLALVAPGCEPRADEATSPPAVAIAPSGAIEVITVAGQPYVETVELPGASVHGFETTRIMSKVSGYVASIAEVNGEEVDIGTVVKADDVLAVLEVPEMDDTLAEKQALVEQANSAVDQADANIRQAEANLGRRRAGVEEAIAQLDEKQALLAFRQAEYQRYEELVANDAARRDLLDEAKFRRDAAKASLKTGQAAIDTAESDVVAAQASVAKAMADKRSAEANVRVAEAALRHVETLADYATIRAPFDGVISRRAVDHGAFVRPASNSVAQPMFDITRNDKVRVVASVPMTKAPQIELDQDVICHGIGGLPGVRVAGKVTRSTVVLDHDSRMLRIDVHCTNPVDVIDLDRQIELQPGMFCTVTVMLRHWDNLPVVPTSAVASDQHGNPYVMLVEDRHCRRQQVTIAFDDAIQVGVSSGIDVGSTVVQGGVGDLVDGQEIEIAAN